MAQMYDIDDVRNAHDSSDTTVGNFNNYKFNTLDVVTLNGDVTVLELYEFNYVGKTDNLIATGSGSEIYKRCCSIYNMMIQLGIANNNFKIILLPSCSATEAEISSSINAGVVNKAANTVYSQILYIISFGLNISNYNVDFNTDYTRLPNQPWPYPYHLLDKITTPARVTIQNVTLPVPDPVEIRNFQAFVNSAPPDELNTIILKLKACQLYTTPVAPVIVPMFPFPSSATITTTGVAASVSPTTIPAVASNTSTTSTAATNGTPLVPPPNFPVPPPAAVPGNPVNSTNAPPVLGRPLTKS